MRDLSLNLAWKVAAMLAEDVVKMNEQLVDGAPSTAVMFLLVGGIGWQCVVGFYSKHQAKFREVPRRSGFRLQLGPVARGPQPYMRFCGNLN